MRHLRLMKLLKKKTKSLKKVGRMTTISDLVRDLIEEIFSRVPLSSLSIVRSTCKGWNDLSKNLILGQKAVAAKKKQLMDFMTIESMVFSLKLDLQGILNDEEEFVHPYIKQISIPNYDQVKISRVYHCDGILLCVLKELSKLLVWNPYLRQSRLIQTRINELAWYTLGYDNNRNHKILRIFYDHGNNIGFEMYDLNSDSWRVLDINLNPDCYDELLYHSGVSLNGNTYFFGQISTTEETDPTKEMVEVTDIKDYLLCFDFTTERFGQRLPLPFNPPYPSYETLTLYCVRDDKLAVLYNHCETPEIIEIWISTNIAPNAVSWRTFLTLDMSLINGSPRDFQPSSFFIDEEKNVAVFFSRDSETRRYQMAYIIGDGGYFKSFNLGEVFNHQRSVGELVGSSYVPSLVEIN